MHYYRVLRRVPEWNFISEDEVYYLGCAKPRTFNQDRVQTFIQTPIDRFFTTRGVPGIGGRLARHLKKTFGIANPRDLVNWLRFKTREYPRGLPVYVRATIVANFLDEVWFNTEFSEYDEEAVIKKKKAAVSIAMSEWKWICRS